MNHLSEQWTRMHHRCKNHPEYKHISVCHEWKSFSAFEQWGNNQGFVDGMSIDRIDPTQNYSPTNCRLATWQEQQCNRRASKNGKSRYKGVAFHLATGKWQAKIKYNHEWKWLGVFEEESKAAEAYDSAARDLFKQFARLNFPKLGEQSALH